MRARLLLPVVFPIALIPVTVHAAQGSAVFTANLLSTCTVLVGTPGVLDLSADGTVLSTNGGGLGTAAGVTVTTTGTGYNVDVTSPTSFITEPSSTSGAVFSTQYDLSGVTIAAGITGGVSTSLNLGVTVVGIDMSVTRSEGFPAGSYTAQTVVTCE